MFIKNNNLAILLFSSTPKSEETKLYVDINNIPPDIDILDFSYKGDLSSNLVEKDLSYLNNSVYNIYSKNKSTAGSIEYAFSLGYEYVFYSHHDIFNLTSDAFRLIQKLCNSNKLNSFGLVGFNIYHDKEINNWESKTKRLIG